VAFGAGIGTAAIAAGATLATIIAATATGATATAMAFAAAILATAFTAAFAAAFATIFAAAFAAAGAFALGARGVAALTFTTAALVATATAATIATTTAFVAFATSFTAVAVTFTGRGVRGRGSGSRGLDTEETLQPRDETAGGLGGCGRGRSAVALGGASVTAGLTRFKALAIAAWLAGGIARGAACRTAGRLLALHGEKLLGGLFLATRLAAGTGLDAERRALFAAWAAIGGG